MIEINEYSTNKLILIIDDDVEICKAYEDALTVSNRTFDPASQNLVDLFEVPEKIAPMETDYELRIAYQGEHGFAIVQHGLRHNTHFAVALIDVRMPPGWGGIETAKRIRDLDPDIEIVIITAYGDYSREEIVAIVGRPDKLFLLRKPVYPEELAQVVLALTEKWSLEQKNAAKSRHLAQLNQDLCQKNAQLHEQIQERKKTELALTESEKNYREVFQNALEGIFQTSPKGLITHANPALVRILGYESPLRTMPLHKKSSYRMFADPARRRDLIRLIAEHDAVSGFECQLLREDRSIFWVSISIKLIRNNQGRVLRLQGFLADISGHKKIQELEENAKHELEKKVEERTAQLRRAQAELLKKERLAAIGQLTATVAHELRNPLGTISLSVYSISERVAGQDEQMDRSIARVQRNITRCDQIIRELLDFTRETPLRISVNSLNHWINDTLNDVRIPAYVTVELKLAPEIKVDMDPERLRQALINVINNACEAMQDSDPPRRLMISTEILHQKIAIRIADTGPGIHKEDYTRIFESLYSTKGFGVGLGLTMVKRIIVGHGGSIEIDSELGSGTVMTLWLPQAHIEL